MVGAGTVEEKVYEKQVFKDGLRRSVTESAPVGFVGSQSKDEDCEEDAKADGGKDVERYFSRDELRSVFTLGPQVHITFAFYPPFSLMFF